MFIFNYFDLNIFRNKYCSRILFSNVSIDFDFDDMIQTRNTLTAKVLISIKAHLYAETVYSNRSTPFSQDKQGSVPFVVAEDSILFDLLFRTSFSFVNRPVIEMVIGQSKLLGVH